jgi:NADH:ubiquinone oxidoreductase subunit E
MIIKVCNWKNCQNNFNSYIIDRLKNDIARFNFENIEIEEIDCMWMCEEWPIVKINKEILKNANPIKASEMMFKKLKK